MWSPVLAEKMKLILHLFPKNIFNKTMHCDHCEKNSLINVFIITPYMIDDVITKNTLQKLKIVIPYEYYSVWCDMVKIGIKPCISA